MTEPRKTQFAVWFDKQGFTRDQAAKALGMSASQVDNLITGRNRGTGKPNAPPTLATRTLMRLIDEGRAVEPWPLEDPEIEDEAA